MGFRGVLKEHASVLDVLLRIGDALLAGVTGWLALLIYLHADPMELDGYDLGLVRGMLLVLVVFPLFDVYRARRGSPLHKELWAVSLAWCAVLTTLTLIMFLTKRGGDFSRGWFLIWSVLGWLTFILERGALRWLLQALRRRGYNLRRIVIVHSNRLGVEVARGLEAAPWTGLKVAALFCTADAASCRADEEKADGGALSRSVARFDGLTTLADYVRREPVDQVWIVLPLKEEETIRVVLHELRHSPVPLRYVPDISGLRLLNQSLGEVAGFPVVNLASTPMDGVNGLLKTIEDRLLSALILLLISPLLLLIALGVKLSSPGPVLFRQQRLGLGGEEITVLKFRSMKLHEDAPGQVTQATKNDARVTPFGAFLRRTSLDELPQFFNVLCGEMSIVGPRPHALAHNEQYKELVDRYMLRHLMKPGITGWAQINGFRGETDTLEKMEKRIEHDLYYIENWSLWLDLKIIALTIVRGFRDGNAY
ncbi:putative CPS biosynthesis glycosyltransferase [Sterolibacterium denitrificans]|nr:undecaprenyl-phosphate glucose phosphotransferase [Sterolibacterium denitrificans]KYC28990.1 UDP-phosphate galactose phosphotransferase [Sterolibacterium denitrificans]SMB22941.1 putative CPS biosynthesis glycosyltransferase [Sterolibacterium denitrificans]